MGNTADNYLSALKGALTLDDFMRTIYIDEARVPIPDDVIAHEIALRDAVITDISLAPLFPNRERALRGTLPLDIFEGADGREDSLMPVYIDDARARVPAAIGGIFSTREALTPDGQWREADHIMLVGIEAYAILKLGGEIYVYQGAIDEPIEDTAEAHKSVYALRQIIQTHDLRVFPGELAKALNDGKLDARMGRRAADMVSDGLAMQRVPEGRPAPTWRLYAIGAINAVQFVLTSELLARGYHVYGQGYGALLTDADADVINALGLFGIGQILRDAMTAQGRDVEPWYERAIIKDGRAQMLWTEDALADTTTHYVYKHISRKK